MKKVIFFLPFLLISATLMAQPPKGKAKKGTVYGAAVDKTGAVSADQLPALLQGKETAQIKIEGEVTEVCQAMGCWMKIKTAAEKWLTANGNATYLKDYAWDYNLVDSKEVNAWCMPGGKIVVYTGILPITKDDAGMAAVMGHEVAHALANHGQQRMVTFAFHYELRHCTQIQPLQATLSDWCWLT